MTKPILDQLSEDGTPVTKAVKKKAVIPSTPTAQLPVATEPQSFVAMIAKAASDPSVNVEKMQALLDVHERILNKQAEIAFNQAMSRLQPKLPTIINKSEIRHGDKLISKYSKYQDIDKVIKPLYSAEGFSISFENEFLPDNKIVFYAILSHEQGHKRRAGIVAVPDTSGSKNALQAASAAETYGKRRTVGMLLNITTGDDLDGDDNEVIDTDKAVQVDQALRAKEKTLPEETAKTLRPRFLKHMGVDDVRNILEKDYQKALTAIAAIGQKPQTKKV